MNLITKHERPGVYSSYEASALSAASGKGKAVAVVAAGPAGSVGTLFSWTGYSRAINDVGRCELSDLARMALKNGAGLVYGVVAGDDWEAAFGLVESVEDAAVVVCGSTQLTVQQKLRDMVERCSAARKERIAVVAGSEGETPAQLVERAKELNCERVVLVAPGDAAGGGGISCAAAVAGAIAANADPALPLGGAKLSGPEGLETAYEDGDIDLLVQGGVTPLEMLGGSCYVVRGVTTRTTTGGAADSTWRELTTVLVVDEVIPGIRNALRAKFARAKNTAQTRGAIRSQVILELEDRVSRQIIDSYEDVTAEPLDSDPTVCLVEFAFRVAHGLNQIWLYANITV